MSEEERIRLAHRYSRKATEAHSVRIDSVTIVFSFVFELCLFPAQRRGLVLMFISLSLALCLSQLTWMSFLNETRMG